MSYSIHIDLRVDDTYKTMPKWQWLLAKPAMWAKGVHFQKAAYPWQQSSQVNAASVAMPVRSHHHSWNTFEQYMIQYANYVLF